ncbi:YbaY family lipoprotein [Coraliomargarita parva]|uniref:YbaY family lipoprotein n=1 Tax=Coraliomargarita parva TaxID=3014050 RepID=UPI0022B5D56F|nr:YbaY family lipoprotein [Coraliomargarita parva]
MKHPILRSIAPLLFLVLTLSANAQADSVSVTMTYRERIALPPDARVDASLLDTSRADAKAVVISAQRFAIDGVPRTIQLPVDPNVIDERHSYTVSARITSGNKQLFRTTTAYPVLTRGAGNEIEILLERTAASPTATPSTATASAPGITGVAWAAFEIGGRLLVSEDPPTLAIDDEGRFSLYAGCNRFRGQVRIEGQELEFPAVFAGTKMACSGARAKLESDVLDTIKSVKGFTRNGPNLSLTNAAGVTVLRLHERPE